MPELSALQVFAAVARGGSFSAAGRELSLTQQAVSARAASLESLTGVRLMNRTSRGVELTSAGAVVLEWAERLLDTAREIDAGLASLRATTRARVRVSASLTIAEQLLPRWLVDLHADAARRGTAAIAVVLTATNSDHVVEHVRDGRADVGFVEGPRAPRGVRSRTVAHDELIVIVRPDHPWARRRTPLTAAELDATPLVVREAGSGTRDSLTEALRTALGPQAGATPPALELTTASAVRSAVLAGSAPAVMSRLAVGDDVARGQLRVVPIADLDLRRSLRAIWLGASVPPAGAVRELLAHIASASGTAR